MAKGDKFYFENFSECTALSKKAAAYLVECLQNYKPDNFKEMLEKMHEIEHSADEKKHEMDKALAKAFVTPVDREDLDMLSHNLDKVTDRIEEVLQRFYIYNIRSVNESVIEFAKNLVKSCDILCDIMAEFENFKRSKKLLPLIIKLNDIEEECDKLYLESMRKLSVEEKDVLVVVSMRKVYECFESCADACEHVGDCIGSVIMKNT